MRLRAIKLGVLAAVLGLGLGCGGDDDDTGGDGNGNSNGNCPAFKSCGGDPTGNWTSDDVCVSNPEKVFAATVNQAACSSALKSVKDVGTSGEYQLGSDKNFNSSIVVSGTANFSFSDACIKALGIGTSAAGDCSKVQSEFMKQNGVKSASCSASGGNCDCEITSDLGEPSKGSYAVSGTNITASGVAEPFCVSGNELKLQLSQGGTTLTFTLSKK